MAATPHPSRNVALVAVVVVTAIVVAVVLGLGSDDSADKTVVTRPLPTTTVATSTTTTAPPAPTTTLALPDGDYTALCAQLQDLADLYGSTISPDRFQVLLAGLDFDGLIAAAPEGIKPSLEVLRDQRQQVLDLLAAADSPENLPVEAFPPAFLAALQQVQAVGVQKCGFSGG